MLTLLRSVLDLSELDWHNVSIDEALRRLAVAPKTGLEAVQAQCRAAQFGANRISPPPSRTSTQGRRLGIRRLWQPTAGR